jgi:hypothetical protein
MATKHPPRLHYLAKRGDKCLRKPERKDQLGSGHEKLRRETLEERSKTLVLHHVGNNPEAAFGVLEVLVLNSRLDDVEGSRHEERGASTGNRSNKILRPRSGVVVAELVKVLLGSSRPTEQLSRR